MESRKSVTSGWLIAYGAGVIRFCVEEWAAWAPDLETPQSWQAWAQDPFLPEGDQTPALTEIPAMQRRRIERLGRMAIQVAFWCEQSDDAGQIPMVFASRHGDVTRSMELLQSLVDNQPLSPTAFGLSVHNAIAALYSIARRSRANYQAIAAGEATAEAALMEAAALLAEGAPEVRVVVYDARLPEVYAQFNDQPDPCYAWCWKVRPATGRRGDFQLDWEQATDEFAASFSPVLPHGLAVMQFLLADAPEEMHLVDGPIRWRWSRHG